MKKKDVYSLFPFVPSCLPIPCPSPHSSTRRSTSSARPSRSAAHPRARLHRAACEAAPFPARARRARRHRIRARLAQAAAGESKARHNVEWLRSGVQMEVRKAFLDGNAAAQRTAAAHDAVQQAKESLRIVQNRYEAGLTTVTELLRAQTAQLDATTSYLLALQDWQVASAQLERAAGVLTPESLLITGAGKP